MNRYHGILLFVSVIVAIYLYQCFTAPANVQLMPGNKLVFILRGESHQAINFPGVPDGSRLTLTPYDRFTGPAGEEKFRPVGEIIGPGGTALLHPNYDFFVNFKMDGDKLIVNEVGYYLSPVDPTHLYADLENPEQYVQKPSFLEKLWGGIFGY